MSAAMMTTSQFPRMSMNLHDLFKKRDVAGRMQIFDFKMQKYKRSSIYFWYKPPVNKERGSDEKIGGNRSLGDDNSSCQYPASSGNQRQHFCENSCDVSDTFKISVKGVSNIKQVLS